MSGIAREQRGIVIILLSDRMVLIRRLGLEVGWVVVETVDREFRRVAVTRLFLDSTRRVMRGVDVGRHVFSDGRLLEGDHVVVRDLAL